MLFSVAAELVNTWRIYGPRVTRVSCFLTADVVINFRDITFDKYGNSENVCFSCSSCNITLISFVLLTVDTWN